MISLVQCQKHSSSKVEYILYIRTREDEWSEKWMGIDQLYFFFTSSVHNAVSEYYGWCILYGRKSFILIFSEWTRSNSFTNLSFSTYWSRLLFVFCILNSMVFLSILGMKNFLVIFLRWSTFSLCYKCPWFRFYSLKIYSTTVFLTRTMQ